MFNLSLTYINMVKMNVTPKGPCEWPHLFKPDTHFGTPGNFNITLTLPLEEAKTIMAQVDEVIEKDESMHDKKSRGSIPYKVEGDFVKIRFKQKAEIRMKDGSTRVPSIAVVDANLQPVDSTVSIGNGSIVKVSYNTRPWGPKPPNAGCSLDLVAVQLIDLKEYANTGFEAVEGGFAVDSVKPIDEETKEEVTEEEGDF